MRKLLFLDFDGVLHAEGEEPLTRLPFVEQCLLTLPYLDIVISSAWRHGHPFEALRSLFSPPLRPRVVGMTPILPDGLCPGGRRREIEAFLASEQACSWVALDDMAELFAPADPHLIWVDPLAGFTDQEGKILLTWYQTGQLPQLI
ncbi:MAG: HAD domain-containing protein [Gloeomargarita sp. SKYG116]|nr:HAD domain-containing protein [Gloeomargarita sp. SKYG116]MDW8400610.1 HAD domain-containing protein [Gloeomargarita sp. SKYGB_i_bin116]